MALLLGSRRLALVGAGSLTYRAFASRAKARYVLNARENALFGPGTGPRGAGAGTGTILSLDASFR
jgi:hypothetical protein